MTAQDTYSPPMKVVATPPPPEAASFRATSTQVITVCIAMLTLLALGFTAYAAREFLIPVAVALLLAIMASPIARALEDRGVSSFLAAAIVTLGFLAAVGLFIYLVIPELALLSEQLPRGMRSLEQKIAGFRDTISQIEAASTEIQEATQSVGATPENQPVVVQEATPLTLALTSIAQIAAQSVAAFLMMFFLLSQRRRMKTIVIAMAKSHSTKKRLIKMFNDIKTRISTYLLAITATSVGVGIVSAAALYLIGFPNALLWGAAVALLNFVPYAGPLVVQLAALFIGVMIYPTFWQAVTPALILWALNFVEGQIVSPWVVAKRVVLNPLSVFLAIVFGGWIWGIAGAVVAVPGLIVAASAIQHWWAPCATNVRRPAPASLHWKSWSMHQTMPAYTVRRMRVRTRGMTTTTRV